MSEKKKDSKGRILRQGERQRSDGRYEFRYQDQNGVSRSVYSWRLTDSDRPLKGSPGMKSLREMEKEIRRDLEDGVYGASAKKLTLNDCFAAYIETKYELKQSTRTNYKYMYRKYVSQSLGLKSIGDVRYSDVKRFYVQLIREMGFKPNSMEIIHTILHPVFTVAVRDGLIRMNPTDGVMSEIKKSYNWEKGKRHALTIRQQEAFISYVATNKTFCHWLPIFTFLLGTGCRVGEAVGLRWEDCDFKENIISINHSLIYRQQDNGKSEYHITTPKTKAGIRIIPMLSEVRKALLQERENQMRTGFNMTVIDGYSGFVFKNRDGRCLSPHSINRAIDGASRGYNAMEMERAKKEKREPELLPHFSAHHLRHTFCTRFCENETNLKVIQEIMGHADIETTMNVYNEATKEKKMESFANLEGKIKIN